MDGAVVVADLTSAYAPEPFPGLMVEREWTEPGFELEHDARLIRHSYRMRIDLDAVAEEPAWPDGIEVRAFRAGDEQLFYDVHEETFADHWEHERAPRGSTRASG